ncbi:MAG TPA: hypothetical protein VE972_02780 [Conexibacter sp.]|nr:hypothetical protein [Conexibacter sp.]
MSIKHLLARRRPSPAMIVACCALFVALGGTSYAFAVGSIGSREIRNHSIGGVDVRADGVGGGAIKEESLDASKLDAARIGTVPRAQTADSVATAGGLALGVRVNLDGRRSLAHGVVEVEHLSNGIYNVVFDRDVSQCIPAATLTNHLAFGDDRAGTGQIRVAPNGDDDRALSVLTADSADVLADHDFYLLVSC